MRAADLINAKADLIRRLGEPDSVTSGTLRRVVRNIGSMSKATDQPVDESRVMQSFAKLALSYRVTEDMATLVEYAASQMGPEDTFDASLALSEGGLIFFEKPVHIMSGDEITVSPEVADPEDTFRAPVRWMLYGPMQWVPTDGARPRKGFVIYFFYDLLLDAKNKNWYAGITEYEGQSLVDLIGRWGLVGSIAMPDGMSAAEQRHSLDPDTPEYERLMESAAMNGHLMMSLFRFLAQTIGQTSTETADPKKLSKTAKRMKIPPQVTTIKLRRISGAERKHDESLVEWHHRWVVRGFWRNQRYGPGLTETKRIWIAPFIKGPPDKPLVTRDRVYSLER